jgi:hypothetical protein
MNENNSEECFLVRYDDAVWLFVITYVSEEHIAFIFRVKKFRVLQVRSEDVPHNGREDGFERGVAVARGYLLRPL